ncbi:hypothetical protein HDU96_002811 [Phlyctochytrium bullatum]|nr:hypothetical protein HDU96_002811 [Phlyctochytrium bullatum]
MTLTNPPSLPNKTVHSKVLSPLSRPTTSTALTQSSSRLATLLEEHRALIRTSNTTTIGSPEIHPAPDPLPDGTGLTGDYIDYGTDSLTPTTPAPGSNQTTSSTPAWRWTRVPSTLSGIASALQPPTTGPDASTPQPVMLTLEPPRPEAVGGFLRVAYGVTGIEGLDATAEDTRAVEEMVEWFGVERGRLVGRVRDVEK